MTKVCVRCKVEKPCSFFGKDMRAKDDLKSACRECRNLEVKTPRQRRMKKARRHKYDNSEKGKAYYKNRMRQSYAQKRAREIQRKYMLKPESKQRANLNSKKRYWSDLNYRICKNIRNRINGALVRGYKSDSSISLLGCSIPELKAYLSRKFTEGMSFENYGKWQIDHIRPCCSFDLKEPEQQKQCFHFTNLQPLWAKDNLSKGAKLPDA
jgi:hypothetical protein